MMTIRDNCIDTDRPNNPLPLCPERTNESQWALQDSNLGPIGYERGICSIH